MTEIQLRFKRFIAQVLIGVISFMQLSLVLPAPVAQAASSTLVISEVEFGGSSSSVEFVELYNKSSSAIDLATLGLKLHIRNGSGTDANKTLTFIGATTIPANGHFLFVNAAAEASLLALADATYTNSGNTLVTDGAAYISTSSANDISLAIDLVGWNSQPAPGFETAPVSGFASGQSIERKPGGINGNATDTDNNAADFTVNAVPNPQNRSSATQPSAPAAPTLLSAIAGNGQVTLTWTSVSGAADYKVYQNSVALSGVTTAPTVTSIVTGLTNGTAYTFQVSARNNFGTEGALSNPVSATPATPTPVPPAPITSSLVYTMNGAVRTNFGVGSLAAQLTTTPSTALTASDNPAITLDRPGSDVVTIPLVPDSATSTWRTQYDFVVTEANSPQDGTVTVTLSTSTGKTFTIVAGSSFTVDTKVNSPVVTINSRCSTNQDSFTATTDNDATSVYIYRHSNLELTHLVAVASVTNGTVDEVFIGDNAISTLYLVAQDSTGNTSDTTVVANDLTAPTAPTLQLEAGTNIITASWPETAGASQYILRWRKVGDATWQERNTTARKHDITVDNDVAYEVSVVSQDAACNRSNVATTTATAHTADFFLAAARGGLADALALREAEIMAQPLMVAETKDGEATPKTPVELEAEKKAAEQRDAEKRAEEERQKQQEAKTREGRNRSRLIVAIAILLIIAGTALAARSWYQGDVASVAPEGKDADTPPAVTTTKKTGKKPGRKPKRKTRW